MKTSAHQNATQQAQDDTGRWEIEIRAMKGGPRRKYLSLIGLGAQKRCEQRHLTVPAHYL